MNNILLLIKNCFIKKILLLNLHHYDAEEFIIELLVKFTVEFMNNILLLIKNCFIKKILLLLNLHHLMLQNLLLNY